MVVTPGGIKGRAIADEVLADKIRHADPIGIADLTCPACKTSRQMTCYRFSSGLFGNRRALHFVCPTCGGSWTMGKADSEKMLASINPISDDGPGASQLD